jgi:hypothetical protein
MSTHELPVRHMLIMYLILVSGGPYAPDRSSGLIAGQLILEGDNWGQRDCFRPTNNLATTCGRGPSSACGKLGEKCDDYYQLVASCRW